jgi:hypothetical protein
MVRGDEAPLCPKCETSVLWLFAGSEWLQTKETEPMKKEQQPNPRHH